MNEPVFFDAVRTSLFKGSMKQEQVDGINAILAACDTHGVLDQEERAYVLATAYWETSRTMQPVREAFWLSEEWRRKNLRYYPYYGRGYVQLTWKENYAKFMKLLGFNFVDKPDLALKAQCAAYILVVGMRDGMFGGKKGGISAYLGKATDWLNARRTVNIMDKAKDIATIGKKFDAAFELAEGPVHVSEPTVVDISPASNETVLSNVPVLPVPVERPVAPPKVLSKEPAWFVLAQLIEALLRVIKRGFKR